MATYSKDMLNRIKVPLVWSKLEKYGVRIEDLEQPRFEDALELVQECYVPVNILTRCVNLKESYTSLNTFMERTITAMNDQTSLVAIDEATNEVVGLAINRVMRQSEYSRTQSEVKLTPGKEIGQIIKIYSTILKRGNVFKVYDTDVFLRNYIMIADPEYADKGKPELPSVIAGLERLLMKTCIELATNLKMDAFAGVFSTGNMQKIGKSLGMDVIEEIFYVEWLVDGEMVFDDPGAGNYSLALMGVPIEKSEPDKTVNPKHQYE